MGEKETQKAAIVAATRVGDILIREAMLPTLAAGD
jgi:hypothetical protein